MSSLLLESSDLSIDEALSKYLLIQEVTVRSTCLIALWPLPIIKGDKGRYLQAFKKNYCFLPSRNSRNDQEI